MADLGRKHVCFKCSSKFYDLKKAKVVCPKCGADQADAPVVAAPPPPPPVKRAPKMVDPVEEEAPAAEEGEEGAESEELDVGADDDADLPGVEEELDEPAGEDSFD